MQGTYVAGATQQLRELARMRAVGMRIVKQIDRGLRGRLSEAEQARMTKGSKGFCWDFVAVARTVRQIIILEMEIIGLRPAERDGPVFKGKSDDTPQPRDLRPAFYTPRDDMPDHYDRQPMGTAVDWIRDTLDVQVPEADPFETAGRRTRSAASASSEAPVEDVACKRAVLTRRYRNAAADRREMAIIRERIVDEDDAPGEPAWRPPSRGPPSG